MLINISLTLDINKGENRFNTLSDPIELRQGDSLADVLSVSLREQSEVLDLTGRVVRLYALDPEGNTIIDGQNVEVTSAADGQFEYTVPPEITQTAGSYIMAYFRVTDEDSESRWSASTPNIALKITKGIALKLRDGDYFPEFDAALADLEASRVAYEQAEDAREAAEEDRALAELGREEAEAYRRAKFAEIEELADGLLYYFCADGEYDPDTRHPIIAEPHAGTHYLTPASHPTENNHWDEWLWDAAGQRWEGYGSQDVVIDPMTVDQAEALFGGSEADGAEGELVTRRILRFVLGKLGGIYAKLVHTHSGADLTDGTVTAAKLASGAVTQAKIADGSVSLAKCDSTLRDSVSHSRANAGKVVVHRQGKMRSLTLSMDGETVQDNSNYTLCTLPAGDRPAGYVRGLATCSSRGYCILNVNTNGTVVLSTGADCAGSYSVQAAASYVVN